MQNQLSNTLSPHRRRNSQIHSLGNSKRSSQILYSNPSDNAEQTRMFKRKPGEFCLLNQSTVNGSLALNESRVRIRENELIAFTQKFAVEKVDYEDQIQALQKQLHSLKTSYMKIDIQYRNLLTSFRHREQRQAQLLSQIAKIKEESARLIQEYRDKYQKKDLVLAITQTENTAIRKELEDMQERVYRLNGKIEKMEKENAQAIGQRVSDIVRLSQNLQITKEHLRNLQIQKVKWKSIEVQNADKISKLQRQIIQTKNTILEESLDDCQKYYKEETQELNKKIIVLQGENEKLQEKLRQSQCKTQRMYRIQQNSVSCIDVNTQNKDVDHVSSQNTQIRRQVKSPRRISSPLTEKVINEALLQKCCELQYQVATLNKKIQQLEQIQFKEADIQRITMPRYTPRMKLSFDEVSEESSSKAEQSCSIEYQCQDQSRKQHQQPITFSGAAKSTDFDVLQTSIKNMEFLIDALRKQNDELREGSKRLFIKTESDIQTKSQDQKLKEIQRERNLLLQQNEYLKRQYVQLQNEVVELREKLVGTKILRDQGTDSSGPESRQERLGFLLKKIAQHSRQIISDRFSPIEFDLFGTIFNRFIKQLEQLEEQQDPSANNEKLEGSPIKESS